MQTHIKIGVLDFLNLGDGDDPVLGLLNLIESARRCDELGFHRYWLGEHWSRDAASPSADLLTPIIAGITDKIRVGPAGVLLNLYSPLKVAANALLTSGLFPDRIDWGIARGIVGEDLRQALVGPGEDLSDPARYDMKIKSLLDYLAHRADIGLQPANARRPDIWILGAGPGSAPLAGETGCSFAVALFLRRDNDARAVLDLYRNRFKAGPEGPPAPQALIAIAGACTETEADARRLRAAWNHGFIIPTVIEPAESFGECLTALCELHGVDECVFLDGSPTHAERLRSLERIADAFALTTPTEVTADV